MTVLRTPLPYALRLLTALFILALSLPALAQQPMANDSVYYRTAPIPAHLQPIERAAGSSAFGSVYFYGGKKLSSPFSLEVPFFELNDPTVSHHFKTFRTMTTLSRLTSLATLAYVLFNPSGRNGTYWIVYGSSIAASLTFSVVGNSHVNRAVARYNELMRQPRVGLSVTPVPLTGQATLGAGIAWGF